MSAVISLDEEHLHNVRFAYQTGFRNPTTQNLYIGLNLGYFTLLGAAPDNFDRYKESVTNTLGNQVDITGNDAYNNAYTLSSVKQFSVSHDPADLIIANINTIQPEQVSSFEFGYRGTISNKFKIDFSAFYSKYNNFIKQMPVIAVSKEVGNVHDNSGIVALSNKSTKAFFNYVNEEYEVRSYGGDIGLKYIAGNYTIGLIYDYIKLDGNEDEYKYNFNTPNHKIKFSLGNPKIYRNIGFKVNYRYQTEFKWGSSFANGIVPERNILDAQINYNIRKIDMQFKIGGTNLLGTEYIVAPGAGHIGSMYYISIAYGK
jgi:hypothetical protein